MARDREHYIVDGYNVINSWQELLPLRRKISEARDKLQHILSEYGAYENYEITLVFDAAFTPDAAHQEDLTEIFHTVYTAERETADSYIERLAYAEVRRGREVYVVTSDGAEQSQILGAGAYRIPAQELRRNIKSIKKDLQKEYLDRPILPVRRNALIDQLDPETAAKFHALRKSLDKSKPPA